jgi:hypothetical protein
VCGAHEAGRRDVGITEASVEAGETRLSEERRAKMVVRSKPCRGLRFEQIRIVGQLNRRQPPFSDPTIPSGTNGVLKIPPGFSRALLHNSLA